MMIDFNEEAIKMQKEHIADLRNTIHELQQENARLYAEVLALHAGRVEEAAVRRYEHDKIKER